MRFLCLVLASIVAVCRSESMDFDEFVSTYGKTYVNEKERSIRKQIFLQNIEKINQHNSEGHSWTMGINHFADMTVGEFRSTILMRPHAARPVLSSDRHYQMDLPTEFDWRNSSTEVVGPVRNQGSVGSCYAFSTAELVASRWALAGNEFTLLSPEQIVDCANIQMNSDEFDCGMWGGYPSATLQWIINQGGLASEADYPYCSGLGNCFPCRPPGANTTCPKPEYCEISQNRCASLGIDVPATAKVTSWTQLSQNATEIASVLVQEGPLSMLLDADPLQFYKGGVLTSKTCSDKYIVSTKGGERPALTFQM